MTANFRKPGLLYPSQSTLALPTPAPFVTRFRAPTHRTQSKDVARKYRRVVRAAEQAAWDATTPAQEPTANTVQDTPGEKFAFAVITSLAVAGIVWGLVNSMQLTTRWPKLVTAIRELIG